MKPEADKFADGCEAPLGNDTRGDNRGGRLFDRIRVVMRVIFAVWLVVVFAAPVDAHGETVTLLADGDVSAWEYHALDDIPETQYHSGFDPDLGAKALFAASQKGASGWLMKREGLDFSKTPWAHFQWRLDAAGEGFDEGEKTGDDYAMRIYFVAQSGIRFRTVVLARTQGTAGDSRKSPYSNWLSDVFIHAFAGGDAPKEQWQTGRANMAEIWRRHFGEDANLKIDAVGLMTDGDSAGVEMRARYGAIVLTDSETNPFAAPQP